MRAALAEARKKSDEGALQQMEELKKKAQKDLEGAQKMLTEMEVAKERAERSKKKLQQEVCSLFIYRSWWMLINSNIYFEALVYCFNNCYFNPLSTL